MKYFLIILLGFFSSYAVATSYVDGGLDTNIIVSIEEPSSDDAKTGITNLRGWAVTRWSDYPIVRLMLSVDGSYVLDIPIGGDRQDVCSAYNYPNCGQSGFSMAYNYGILSNGYHTFTVTAYDSAGFWNESSVTFRKTGFNSAYIANNDSIAFGSRTQVSLMRDRVSNDWYDKRIYLENVLTDDGCFDIMINWNRATQSWRTDEVVQISDSYCAQY